jgi:hypothetical protein
MASKEDDYTKYRTVGNIPYDIEDIIGRQDYQKYNLTISDPTTVSGSDGKILR